MDDFEIIRVNLFFEEGATPNLNNQECFSFLPNDDPEVEVTEEIDLVVTSLDLDMSFPVDDATIRILDNGEA